MRSTQTQHFVHLAVGVLAITLMCRMQAAEMLHFATDDGGKCWALFQQAQTAYQAKDYKKYTSFSQQARDMKLGPEALAEVQEYRVSAQYNVACGLALTGEKDKALDELSMAIDLGYDDIGSLKKDTDLASLRDEKRFKDLCARAEKLATAAGDKREFQGTLVQLEHMSRVALLVPGKEKADAVAALVLEIHDKTLQKNVNDLLQKKVPVKVEGQGGTMSYKMKVILSAIAPATEAKK